MRLILPAILLLAGCGSSQPSQPAPGRGAAPFRAEAALPEQLPCAPRGELVARLAAGLGQRPVALGLAHAGGLIAQASAVEILAAPEGVSWTAVVTAPNGTSCILAGGEAWQQLFEPAVALPR